MAGIEANVVSIAISIGLLLLMQAGFLCLETGLVRSKNSINVAAKNLTDLIFVIAIFWMFSFSMIYGESMYGFIALPAPFADIQPGKEFVALFFLFQALFCATAITIVSGCIAERCQLKGYIAISVISSLFIYPFIAHWIWGGITTGGQQGWLKQLGFYDFAGSTVVHSVGGWVALSALLIIGPRTGINENTRHQFKGQNLALTILGVFFLWIGWFGFNGGSNLGETKTLFAIFVNTAVAGAFGGIAATFYSLFRHNNFDVSLMGNGVLSGLVAVTASCSVIPPGFAAILGIISSGLTCVTVDFFIKKNLDDVVGAIPVHLVGGLWGTIAVALFGDLNLMGTGLSRSQQTLTQIFGAVVVFAWAFPLSYILIKLVNKYSVLRVSPEDELIGLNVSEHNARNELHDLIVDMECHIKEGDYKRPVRFGEHSEVGVIAAQYNRVVSQVVTSQEKLKNTINQLQETQRLLQEEKVKAEEANINKSEFLANMSHEIRTPLNGIYGVCQLISHSELNEEQSEYFKIINRSTETLVHIVSDILDYSKIEAGEISIESHRFSANDLFNDIDSIFMVEAKRNHIDWQVSVADDFPDLLMGDNIRLTQILINMVGNAFKFTDQGKIEVKASYDRQEKILAFSISDTGIGISQEEIATIFHAYQQAKNQERAHHKGTGLGLSICRKIVELMGGQITVTSQLNSGTTFEVTLPMDMADGEHADTDASGLNAEESVLENTKLSALIVDDNNVNLFILQKMLESIDMDVTVVGDGMEAVSTISNHPERFDIVFMDCEMPIMDGFQATNRIREIYATTPRKTSQPIIVGLSAHAFSSYRNKALSAGMDGYLTKPVNLEDIKQSLSSLYTKH